MSGRCLDCFTRLAGQQQDGWCSRCDRRMRDRWEQADAEEQALARRDAPAVSVDQRECEVCLQPSSFSPCQRCTDSEYGPLGRRDQTW